MGTPCVFDPRDIHKHLLLSNSCLLLLPSEWVWGVRHAAAGVSVPEQECSDHPGGTAHTPRQTLPAEEEAKERHPQGRAATEM